MKTYTIHLIGTELVRNIKATCEKNARIRFKKAIGIDSNNLAILKTYEKSID